MKAFALLTATVLVVIAIGVGIIAATEETAVYGPPGARFTMSFPGSPTSRVLCPSGIVPRCPSGIPKAILYMSASPAPVRLLAEVSVFVDGSRAFPPIKRNWLTRHGPDGTAITYQVGSSVQGIRLPITCGEGSGLCNGSEAETDGRTTWVILVNGESSPTVQALLASFRPV